MKTKNINDIVVRSAVVESGSKDATSLFTRYVLCVPLETVSSQALQKLHEGPAYKKDKAPVVYDLSVSKPYKISEYLLMQAHGDEVDFIATVPTQDILVEKNSSNELVDYTAKSLVEFADKITQGHFKDYLN